MKYKFKKQVYLNFDETVERVRLKLKEEGFGVLTEIDVKSVLKKKLNVDYEDYLILGACNPPFAYKALEAEKDVGLLLPCNVIVYVDKGKTYVSVISPLKAMSITNNDNLRDIAEEIERKLKKIINSKW